MKQSEENCRKMSLCFRTIPNKLTSFVNTRKQVTKIDRQLPKHIKSSQFLEEFLGTQFTVNTRNSKEGISNIPSVYILPQSRTHVSNDAYSEWVEISNKKCNQSEEQLLSSRQYEAINTQNLGILNHNVTKGIHTNAVTLENTTIEPLTTCNGFLRNDRLEPPLCNPEVLFVNRVLYSPLVGFNIEKEKTLLAESLPDIEGPVEKQPEKQSTGPSEDQLQAVFDCLSEDLPKLFVKPFNYNIYTQDILLINNIRGLTTTGLLNYVKQVSLVRVIGHLKFAYVKYEIIKITMHPEDATIKVRWRIKGISGMKVFFMFWKLNMFNLKDTIEKQESWYDGFSTYYVNGDGKVFKHIIDKMMPNEDLYGKEKTPIAAKLALFTALLGIDTHGLNGF